ncbi:MAG: 4Fe-4S dicluster domain-containing protein [Coriobacteriia bacterium]|nr:4Fe-4S dicluster domain-containing protein [Coriobacteriia bacterium]
MAEKQYGLVVDTKRCVGCHSCSVACKIENNLSAGVIWNRILTNGGASMDSAKGTFPNLSKHYIPMICQHCANPACTKACPVGATYKDITTGAVRQDYDLCIGCRMCMAACPYTGVRSFNWEEPTYTMDFAVGDINVPKHQKHVVEKCTLCYHKLSKGEEPICIDACISGARVFGDLNDPDDKVVNLISKRKYIQLLPERGTNPSVYYLV